MSNDDLEAGRTVLASVEGRWTATGEACSLAGRVVDCTYTTQPTRTGIDPTLATYAGRATLIVESDEGERTVGGWGATVEDCEATRITVESVE